jgi:hypothetical protein
MTTASVITMIVVLGGLWGGFAWLLRTAIRSEEDRDPPSEPESTTG